MKIASTISLTTAAIIAICLPNTSHALVHNLAACESQDGKYQITVSLNFGIGPDRSHPAMTASVIDAQGNRSGAPVHIDNEKFHDDATNGQLFELRGPSANVQTYEVHMVLNGQTIDIKDLACGNFDTTPVK